MGLRGRQFCLEYEFLVESIWESVGGGASVGRGGGIGNLRGGLNHSFFFFLIKLFILYWGTAS